MALFITNFSQNFALPLSNPVIVFMVLLLIVLLAPILLNKIHIPSIIGLIISGIIIGPFGLNLIPNDGVMQMFSTIGLMYIMFTAGLELDFNEFRINQNKSLIFGVFTFIVPLLIGYPVCHYILGYGPLTSFLTASMFSTHTLISYPIVSRMGVSKNQAVAITVGGTIFTDAAVLIILAIVTTGGQGGLSFSFLLRLIVSLAIFSAIVFFVIPKLARIFFRKIGDDKYLHYVFVLFILFLCGFFAQMGGLEPIIGAFAAGLALNQLIPHSSALMNRIDFFGNALFIPIFLISVGMIVDLSVIRDGWNTLKVAFSLTIVALAGKYFAALFTQKVFGYTIDQRNLIFGLSSSHAAATLAIIITGFNAGILDDYILNGTIILILITCVISSIVTQKASRQIALQQNEGALSISTMGKFAQEKILVSIANPNNIGHLIEFALLIKDKKSENSISLLGVVPNDVEAEKNIINFRRALQNSVSAALAAETKVDIITTIDHNISDGIVRTARETMADIVIMGWPGKIGLLEKWMGYNVEKTIKKMDRNLFMCYFENPLVTHNRIVIISPPLAEMEYGFELWVRKIVELSQELSAPILHIGHPNTHKVISEQKTIESLFTFMPLEKWDEPNEYKDFIKKDDLIVIVSAHVGYISYVSSLDSLPTRIENVFQHFNRVVIYPQQYTPKHLLDDQHPIFTT